CRWSCRGGTRLRRRVCTLRRRIRRTSGVRAARLLYSFVFEVFVLVVAVGIFVFVIAEIVVVEIVVVFIGFFFVFIVGDVELERRQADHLEVRPALGAAQLIALVDVEFIDLDFGVAFWARSHHILRL